MTAEAYEQQPALEVDEKTIAFNPSFIIEDPVSELNLEVTIMQQLINLEEEPVATNVEEEPKPIVDLTAI